MTSSERDVLERLGIDKRVRELIATAKPAPAPLVAASRTRVPSAQQLRRILAAERAERWEGWAVWRHIGWAMLAQRWNAEASCSPGGDGSARGDS